MTHACCEQVLKAKKRRLSCDNSVPYFFKSSSGTRASPHVMLDIGDDDPDNMPTVQEEVPPS
jgi:hypothetical protein